MKKLSLLLVLMFSLSVSFAQQIKWIKASNKLPDYAEMQRAEKNNSNALKIMYINQYNVKIKIVDKAGVKVGVIKEKFNLQNRIYRDINIGKKAVSIFYETFDGLCVRQYDYNGKMFKELKLIEKPKTKILSREYPTEHRVMFNEENTHFVIFEGTNYYLHQLMCKDKDKPQSMEYFEVSGRNQNYFFAKKFTVYDMDFNLKSTYKTMNKDFPTYSSFLGKDGALYFIEPSKNTELVKVQNNVVTKVPFAIERVGIFKPFLKEQDGKLMVASTIGIDNFSLEEDLIGGRLHFMYSTVNYQLFNSSDLKREYTYYYDFTKNEIEKSWTKNEATNKRKFAGITFLRITDIKFVNSNEIIVTMCQKNDIISYLKFSNIYLNKVSPKGVEKSLMIDRIDSENNVYYGYSDFPISLVNNNKFYLFFAKNEFSEIGFKEYDFTLKETKSSFRNYKKEGGIEPLTDKFYKISDKQVVLPCFWGQSKWIIEL
jgi:hypothetical protein